jgi:hypothetical protein
MYDREFTSYSQAPSWCLFYAFAGIGEAVTSVDLTSATGNWVELPWALYMMAAVDHRTALLLNQSGKVRNLKTGESRGYKLLYCTHIQKKDRSLQGNGPLGRLELPTLGLPGGGKREQ